MDEKECLPSREFFKKYFPNPKISQKEMKEKLKETNSIIEANAMIENLIEEGMRARSKNKLMEYIEALERVKKKYPQFTKPIEVVKKRLIFPKQRTKTIPPSSIHGKDPLELPIPIQCPDCGSKEIYYDKDRNEIVCKKCGLVLSGT